MYLLTRPHLFANFGRCRKGKSVFFGVSSQVVLLGSFAVNGIVSCDKMFVKSLLKDMIYPKPNVIYPYFCFFLNKPDLYATRFRNLRSHT